MGIQDVDPKFEYRATGVLGTKREAMLTNELHARPQLARPVQRGHTVPDITFGLTYDSKDGGVPEAITRWNGSDELVYRKSNVVYERDFVGLNRAAVVDGLVTSKEHNVYRATHEMKRKVTKKNDQFITSNETAVKFVPRRIPANMVYGLPTR